MELYYMNYILINIFFIMILKKKKMIKKMDEIW